MNHEFHLIDGIVWNGKCRKRITLQPLDEQTYEQVNQVVETQLSCLKKQPNFCLVNDSHRQGLKGYMMLNECAAASISHLEDQPVSLMFDDLCRVKISAQDWNIILTANLALCEFYGDDAASSITV
ncbi:6-phospho-beta-glucosidase [Vibrio parahaemolyticus]|uniref:6-phospho-beta-glucosidase n=1 Tax=Vibrio harveyi group TaxID=717610 RepID=UPI000943E86F|nr:MULTISPECIES: 6-phospho-beta-glucosidase [Vibrio harveyi group]QLK43792.1 6-phospho-beta-glucosidase [Vibrio owensii]HDM8216582.1 6-phospho-beta-glucosidase [Vibrio campbellii]EGQ7892725.1 6-phospho-beta-glucosidase [Vibrio parahaemolyticus]EHH1228756.1 6-phospho-beta-glucosidase [Vibrio parahaemolyticus]EJG1819094.1 6-phospho-beta-glucosidase [Vibrio parahaemolyticus]